MAPLFVHRREVHRGLLLPFISFGPPHPAAALSRSGCECSHFADEGTEAGDASEITGLACSPRFLSPSPCPFAPLKTVARLTWGLSALSGAVGVQSLRGLGRGGGSEEKELSPFLEGLDSHLLVLFRRTTSVCKVRITCITEAVAGHDADSAVELVPGGFSVSDAW